MKGLSEIVAISLLLAIAVLLAIGFIYWGSGVYSSQSNNAQGIFNQGVANAYADVDITNATWFSGNNSVYVVIENTGGIDLTKVYVLAGGVQIGYINSINTGGSSVIYFVLGSKPDSVIVSSFEGASDEQQV